MSATAHVIDFNPYRTSSTAAHQVGTKYETPRGDIFRYAKAGASNISKGKLQVCPAPKTNHHNVAWASGGALGASTVTVTLGATAAVANEYAEGVLVVNDATGEGTSYRIVSHPAAESSATLELTLERPVIGTALVSGSEMTLVHNPWNGVVEAAVEERQPAGVPLVNVTAGEFCWLKTRGTTAVLQGDATNVGEELVQHASTAGAVDAASTTYGTAFAYYTVGKAKVAGVDTEYNPVELTID
jgi:hypothetical protein